MSCPPPLDLRVLCRKLSSIPPAQLPHALPALTRHVARCRHVLSAPQEQKPKDDAARGSLLVHKLKASITSLLTGRNPDARFAAVGLVKAVVDVGGWETLRGAEPWARGLLSIIQRGDALATKELAIVTLTRIYVLLQPYQTLVREIATPTIPAFATACLDLIKPTSSSLPPAPPAAIAETICDAFSILIPLYPTTFRPFASKARLAVRSFLAPTSSDGVLVPQSLQRAAGRLVVSLHHVAAKSGSSDDWAKMVDGVIRELHATAHQVLRAVHEALDSSEGCERITIDPNGEPSAGAASADQLPPWTGLHAGAERLIGLFHHLADYLTCPTRGPVAVPLSVIMGVISRVCLIAKPTSKSQNWDQALETNPAIGREEKEELWSLTPEIHVAAMDLTLAMLRRFEEGLVPLVPEMLDNLVRIFRSGMDIPAIRQVGYLVLEGLLSVAGPTMSKPAVTSVESLVAACCRDLQQDAGLLKPNSKPASSGQDSKKNGVANADLFLQPSASAAAQDLSLGPDHRAAADRLLPALFSSLPQQHLKANLRGLLDKTAILTRSRDAMLASVLHPYRDQRGRMYPSILPHLSRQYPHDQGLEIIRTNLRVGGGPGRSRVLVSENVAELQEEEEEEEEEEEVEEEDAKAETEPATDGEIGPGPGAAPLHPPVVTPAEAAAPIRINPFAPLPPTEDTATREARQAEPPPKRKHEGSSPNPPKRREAETPAAAASAAVIPGPPAKGGGDGAPGHGDEGGRLGGEPDDDDDSDESVHLNMELDDDDDAEELDGGAGEE